MKRNRLSLEQLETRYAPATLVNPFTVTYLDENNDKIAVTISKPLFDAATINNVFTFDTGFVDGNTSTNQRPTKIDLSILPAAGVTLTISNGGNTPIGIIDATGLDLAAIIGDFRVKTILAGDADLSTPGVGQLQCTVLESLGAPSVIQGDLSIVKISGELNGFLDVQGSIRRFSARAIRGEAADDSGHLHVAGSLGTAKLKEDIDGDNGGVRTGFIEVGGDIGKIIALGALRGQNTDSGVILSGGSIGVVRLGGDLRIGNINTATGTDAARISAAGSIGKVVVGGEIRGLDSINTGSIFAGTYIGSVTISADLRGGAGLNSGSISTQTGRIGSVKIGGSIFSGTGIRSGSIRSARDLGSVKVAGNLDGDVPNNPVTISAFGQVAPVGPTDLAIGSIKIGGNIDTAKILAGFNTLGSPFNEDAQIGSIRVAGSWVKGSIAAGVDDGADNLFGTADDALIIEAGGGDPNIVARIGKIIIGGSISGSGPGGDGFGFVAEEIGSLSIDGVIIALASGASNDSLALGGTGDFNLEEV